MIGIEMKYVVFRNMRDREETVVILPKDYAWHSDVKRSGHIISAGFVYIDQEEGKSRYPVYAISCFGRSESLNADSRAEADSNLIHKQFGLPKFNPLD